MRYFYQTILTVVLATLILSGCSTKPEPADSIVVDKSLPTPHINGDISDTKAIAFEWRVIDDDRVKGINIYRSSTGSTKLSRVASIDNPIVTHYTDDGLEPGRIYSYAFTTFNKNHQESKPSKIYKASTLKLPERVAFFTATHKLARSAKLIWKPHNDLRINGYIIERYDSDKEKYKIIQTLEGRLHAEYIDEDLADNTIYRYRIKAIGYNDIVTEASDESTVSTKPLPKTPLNLKVSKDLVRTIQLSWTPQDTQDVTYYKLYRSYNNSSFSYHAKLNSTSFTDKPEDDGATYCYRVSAVDADELESHRSPPVCGNTLKAPDAPTLLNVKEQDGAAKIVWKRGDNRASSYTLIKVTKSGWLDQSETEIKNIKSEEFTDVNVVAGRTYVYQVVAVDKNSLHSERSNEQQFELEVR